MFGGRGPGRTLIAVAIGWFVPVGWTWWARIDRPSDGTLVLPAPGLQTARLSAVYEPGSGLRTGDVVTAVDGVPLDTWVGGDAPHVSRHIGDVLHYTVVRRGDMIDVPVRLSGYPFSSALRATGVLLALVLVLLIVVSFVFVARPRDPAARLMFMVGVALPCVMTEYPLGLQIVDLAGDNGTIAYLGGDFAACILWGSTLCFTLVFPERTSLLRRHRWVGPGCFALPVLLWLLSWSWSLPQAHSAIGRLFVFMTVSTTAARVTPVLIALGLVLNYRRSRDPDVRRRLRWIGASLAIGITGYLGLGQLPVALGYAPIVSYRYLVLLLVPVPLAVGAAILRYRLFDIEVILTRSLLVGALSAVVAVMYVLVVVLTPRIGLQSSTLMTLLAGSAIAIAAFGLRRWLARRITRLVYGDRNDPHAVVSRLSALTSITQTDEILPDVVSTLATTLRLSFVRLELLSPAGAVDAAAEHGERTGTATVLPIMDGATALGRLELAVGAGREPFGPADRRLLDDLSHQVGSAARAVAMTRDLQRSRELLVLAREEERRRLRRDLHDGVGPSLAAQAMQLDVAATLVRQDPGAAVTLLQKLSASTAEALSEIRQIVEDLRPAAVDQLGLVSAIREHTRRFDGVLADAESGGFWVEVFAESDLGQLPAAVEVAAFRIAVEAVSNAARYSGGHHCEVRLRRNESGLDVTIIDDGGGLRSKVLGTGVGLGSMRERAAELGGVCTIADRIGGLGTMVSAQLPLRRSGPVEVTP